MIRQRGWACCVLSALTVGWISLAVSLCSAQSPEVGLAAAQRNEIDRLFARFNNDTPGAALAVAREGEIVYKQGYGMANLEYDIPITPASIFHVASVSKEFTAMSIVLLAQQGRLSLDDEVRKHLPEVPDFGEKITVRHLIHHVSGLRDQWELMSMAGWRSLDVKTQRDVLDFTSRQQDLNFSPGEEYLYCNTGYTLLATIVERVTGRPLDDFAREQIFEPLGMRDTHFHSRISHIVKGRTYAYSPDGEGYRNNSPQYETYGATSLFTTVGDMAKWAENFATKKVGGEAGVAQMIERGELNDGRRISYAFGLQVGEYRGLPTVGHSGSDAGYRAQFTMYPDQRTAIVVLSNVSNGNPGGLARGVADIVLEGAFPEEPSGPSARGRGSRGGNRGRRGGRGRGQRGRGGRAQAVAFTEEERSEMTGDYYSEELVVTYSIVAREGELFLHRNKFEDSRLRRAEEGVLSFGNRRIRFTRDGSDRITGFELTSGRVRNLRFVKR